MRTGTIEERLLYRDALLLVIDKPAGLAVHPGAGGGRTLADELDGLRFGLPRRPEVAHRLDRETSGCLLLGRHRQALARLGRLFSERRVEKFYWAVVEGGPDGEFGEIDLRLARASADPQDWRVRPSPDGEPALTLWRVLGRGGGLAWMELRPVTGRTHQLRAHCAAAGWPILGDRVYGSGGPPLHLHARRVVVPLYPKKPAIVVEAPVPGTMAETLGRFPSADAGPLTAPGAGT